MQKYTIIVFIFFSSKVAAQYTGGNNDGFIRFTASSQNALPNIYRGGVNDGFAQIQTFNQNTLLNIYLGGSNDGYMQVGVVNQNGLANIYKGGQNDGYQHLISIGQNPLPNIYTGGSNDGFFHIILSNQNVLTNIYRGNSNDGFTSKIIFGQNSICNNQVAIWNGSVSFAWENPANWDCGTLPNINSSVLIPSGLLRYPTVSFTYEIKSLVLQPGSTITVLPSINFTINGN